MKPCTYRRQPFAVEEHPQRLRVSADTMGVPMPPLDVLRSEIAQAADDNVWIRVTLTLGGQRIVQSHPLDLSKVGRPVRCATILNPPPFDLPGFVKHGSRAAWNMAVSRLAVDEVIL